MIALLLARALVMPAAGAIVTAAQLNLPSAEFWEKQLFLQWVGVVGLTLFAFYDAGRSIYQAAQAARIREYDNDLRASLSVLISMATEITGAPWDELTVRYYRLRGHLFGRRLELVAAVCAGANIVEADRSIRPGFGVVGTAFSRKVVLAEEWAHFVQAATELGPDAWDGRSSSERYGLSWGQLRRSAQLDGVVASPTFAPSGKPDGCLSLSGPLKLVDLEGRELRRTLDELAAALDQLGPPPMGWWGAHDR